MTSPYVLRDYSVQKIHEQGYVSLPLSLGPGDIDALFDNFGALLDEVFAQPSEHGAQVIEAFNVTTPGRLLDSAGYLEQRRVSQTNPYEFGRLPGSDNKDLLHFTPVSAVKAPEHMRSRGGMSKAMSQLIKQCAEVHRIVEADVAPVLQSLGLAERLISPSLDVDNVHVLRLIRYLGNASSEPFISNDPLASLHFDRSKVTAALSEDRPGLVGVPANNHFGRPEMTTEEFDALADQALRTPIQHHAGRLKLFAGAGYNRLPAEVRQASGELPPLLHGVTDDRPGEERKAVVFFINEHAGVENVDVAAANECDFDATRQEIFERRGRYGAVQEDAS